MNNDFRIKWLKKQDLKDCIVIAGMPGVGSVSHISVDYLIMKLKAELVCKIYSDYLPNIALIRDDSIIEEPCYKLYFRTAGKKNILFIMCSHALTNEYYNYKINEFFADFLKKNKVKEVITIAGIAMKNLPKKIGLFGVVNDEKVKKQLKNSGLFFNGNKNVSVIIGGAGLLLTKCAALDVPGFCVLVSTWGHPSHVGIKESKKTIEFLSKYAGFRIDFTDLNREIQKLRKNKK
ncbi:hypothetical protein COZ55_01165 [archaeon CG_4_8_14_3_um_filter_38_5]|nr:MAG: hypothetical protein COZ55_01165 [archaeon CG_4_8_14_3_um_filter_38_5]